MTEELCDLPAVEQARRFRHKEVSARELLDAHLRRIEDRNPVVNAIVAMDVDIARSRAAELDDAVAAAGEPAGGSLGPLAGLVTAHKDLLDTRDFVSTYGSSVYADHRPTADSLIVTRMKAAGAIAVGKTNVPEFGAGSHSFNSVYGTTVNPYDATRSAGGSSGGAAAALACGMVAVADGSDFGGSLRNPAAWNNVVGFRPSAGVVAAGGDRNVWHPMPIHGPMARNIDDLNLLLWAISRPDPSDPVGHGLPSLPLAVEPVDRPLRVAWSADLGGLPVEPEITETLNRLVPAMEDLGWSITDDEPSFDGADETFVTLRAFNYGGHNEKLRPDFDQVKATVRDEIDRGISLSGERVTKAFKHLKTLWDRGVRFFEDYDLLVAPVTQLMPFPAELEYPTEVAGVEMKSYIDWMRSCCRITAFGLPALSLPAGFSNGLPVGVQLVGRPHGDSELLRAAKTLETALAGSSTGTD